jgi:hypothetical protein
MLTLRSQRSQRHRQIRRNELDLNGSIWLARVMSHHHTAAAAVCTTTTTPHGAIPI